MTYPSRVLCAIDIDDSTTTAFAQALAIARARDARLLLVCAVTPGEPFSRRATERLAYLLKRRREAEAAGVDVHVSVQTGEAAEIVLLYAASRQADLIVVGVEHGRGEGRAWGAVAEDILRSAPCPTLILSAGAAPRAAFTKMLCAVDLTAAGAYPVDEAVRLADPREHAVTVLHVAPAGETTRALGLLHAAIPDEAKATTMARVVTGSVATEVLKAARAMEADLLVIGARRRTRVGRRLFGVTRRLLVSAHAPVLAIPARDAVVADSEREAA